MFSLWLLWCSGFVASQLTLVVPPTEVDWETLYTIGNEFPELIKGLVEELKGGVDSRRPFQTPANVTEIVTRKVESSVDYNRGYIFPASYCLNKDSVCLGLFEGGCKNWVLDHLATTEPFNEEEVIAGFQKIVSDWEDIKNKELSNQYFKKLQSFAVHLNYILQYRGDPKAFPFSLAWKGFLEEKLLTTPEGRVKLLANEDYQNFLVAVMPDSHAQFTLPNLCPNMKTGKTNEFRKAQIDTCLAHADIPVLDSIHRDACRRTRLGENETLDRLCDRKYFTQLRELTTTLISSLLRDSDGNTYFQYKFSDSCTPDISFGLIFFLMYVAGIFFLGRAMLF